jgi:hypothetical protein
MMLSAKSAKKGRSTSWASVLETVLRQLCFSPRLFPFPPLEDLVRELDTVRQAVGGKATNRSENQQVRSVVVGNSWYFWDALWHSV